MKWYTHAAVGANAIWLTALTGHIDEYTPLLIAVGAFAALWPDIDATNKGAKIHYMGSGILGMFKGVFQHRSFFHSFLATTLLLLFSLLFLRQYHPLLPWVLTLGYVSHPLIDGFNLSGVRYLFPFKKFYRLIPYALTTPVGGTADSLFFVLGIGGIALFIFSHLSALTTFTPF